MRSNGSVGGVTWFLARAGAGRRLAAGLGLAALLGLTGAVVLTAWAGARRTESAYARLEESVAHADLLVGTEGDPSLFDPEIATEGPGIARAAIIRGFPMAELDDDGLIDLDRAQALIAPDDAVGFAEIDRLRILDGRAPDPDARDEIVVPEAMRDAGYPIGRTLEVCLVDLIAAFEFGEGVLEGTGTVDARRRFVDAVCELRTLEVVGITGPGPDEVVLRADSESESFPVGSPAVSAAREGLGYFSFVLVDLDDGAAPDAYVDSVLDRTDPAAGVSFTSATLRAAVVDRTLEPHVRSLALFAAALALAALAVLGPSVVRWAGTPDGDRAALRAMGVRPHQMRVASALRGAAVGGVGAVVAVLVAVVASDRFPRGIAAAIEPEPGRRADFVVLATGVLVLVLVTALLGAAAGTGDRARSGRASKVGQVLPRLGLGPAALSGVRSAVAGDGRAAGIARTAAGVGVAVGAVAAALTYQAGLDRLLEDPARYGWTWDEVIDVADSEITPELIDAFAAAPDIDGVSTGYRSLLLRGADAVPLFAFDRVRGDAYPRILEGRAPEDDREIALGGQTLDRLDLAIGDVVRFRGPQGQPVSLEVVGQTLLPLVSLSADLSVGEGGLVDPSLIEAFGTAALALMLVDAAPDAPAGTIQGIVDDVGPLEFGGVRAGGPTLTADLRGYRAVRTPPAVLAGVRAVLGLGVLAHAVGTSVRRRRRELAILRSLGFVRRDLGLSVASSVLALVLTGLVVALPIGVAAGRAVWIAFASGIGVDSGPVTPVVAVAVVAAGTLFAAALVAVPAARRAGRIDPAQALRAE